MVLKGAGSRCWWEGVVVGVEGGWQPLEVGGKGETSQRVVMTRWGSLGVDWAGVGVADPPTARWWAVGLALRAEGRGRGCGGGRWGEEVVVGGKPPNESKRLVGGAFGRRRVGLGWNDPPTGRWWVVVGVRAREVGRRWGVGG